MKKTYLVWRKVMNGEQHRLGQGTGDYGPNYLPRPSYKCYLSKHNLFTSPG